MNPLEIPETLLRGFRPRPPSPKVRRALFGSTPPTAPRALRLGLLQIWFAPLAATAMVVLSLATAWSPGGSGPVATVAHAGFPGSWDTPVVQIERNALPRARFLSGTRVAATPGLGSLLLRQTNALVR